MIKAKEVYNHYRSNPHECLAVLREALSNYLEGKPGGIKPDEFSLRDLAAYFVQVDGEPIGYENVDMWARGHLIEAAVSSSAFAVITQRIVNTAVLEGYRLPDTPLSRTIPVLQVRTRETRVPNLTIPLAEGKTLEYAEAQDKPIVSLYAEYVKPLPLVKRGAHLPITREAVAFDDTGAVLDAARRLGEVIALEKERTLTRYVCGLVSNCVIEKRVTDSSEVTSNLFLTSGRWVNSKVNALTDWTSFDSASATIIGNTLPGTSYPPMLVSRYCLVPPQLTSTANRILNATEVRSGSGNIVVSGNPLANAGITLIESVLAYTEQVAGGVSGAVAAGTWFYGDLSRAFKYVRAWDVDVVELRDDSALRRADILVAFDVTECGVPVVVEPRLWAKNLPS